MDGEINRAGLPQPLAASGEIQEAPSTGFPAERHQESGNPSATRRVEFDWVVRLGWIRSPQSIEVRFGTSRAGAVDVALYRCANVDALPAAHSEVDWGQLRAVEKGRRSPLAALAKQAAVA
ncbi:hypothetical protein [Streptomyces sp. NPDC003032]